MLERVDTLIVGGGIVGAGLIRDLTLHGQKCLLIDKGDFSAQTSSKSSKMLHGGIRYLAEMDFDLVQEALHEKNLWLKLAPHLCYEMPFTMPVFKDSKYPVWMLGLGLFTYDFLSSFENTPFSVLGREKTIKRVPGLNNEGLKGSGIYYDAVVDDCKLGLECIYDSMINGKSQALNYHEIIKLEQTDVGYNAEIKDTITGKHKIVHANDVIMAVGPFTDKLMHKLEIPWQDKLLPSKGIHLWLEKDSLDIEGPVVLMTDDDRVIFVIPQKNVILVGTTEGPVKSDYFNIEASDDEVQYLIEQLKRYFPKFDGKDEQIISSFAGIRPLVKEGDNSDLGKTSRLHKVFKPQNNLYVIAGGKYTTFRKMAGDLAEQICQKRKIPYDPDKTKRALRQNSVVSPFINQQISSEDVVKIVDQELVRTWSDLLYRRLGLLGENHWPFDISKDDLFSPIEKYLKEKLIGVPEFSKKKLKTRNDTAGQQSF